MAKFGGKLRAKDDFDLSGHHILDWRHLDDLPQGNAQIGQALLWDGTAWAPGEVVNSITTVVTALATETEIIFGKFVQFNSGIKTDVIDEVTLGAGVTVDGMLIKDGGVAAYDDHLVDVSNPHAVTQAQVGLSKVINDQQWRNIINGITTDFPPGNAVADDTLVVQKFATGALRYVTAKGVSDLFSITAGANISVNVTTVSVVDSPTFAGTVTADELRLAESTALTKTQVKVTRSTTVSGISSTTFTGVEVIQDVEAASGSFLLNKVRAYNAEIALTDSGATLSSAAVHLMRGTLDAGNLTVSGRPVEFKFTNPSSAQLFAEGFLSIDVSGGTAAGDVIAAFTRARPGGSATGIGYKGFASGLSGASGAIIGVQGYASNLHTHSEVVSLDGNGVGSTTAKDKVMGLRSKGHVLVRSGSVFCVTGAAVATPNAASPTFVQAGTNTGEFYAEGNAEFGADLCIASPTVPSTASATGITGQISWDSSYVYLCVAANTWKRTAILTW